MVPYLTNKGEHTAHYKITKNAYIKLWNLNIITIVIILFLFTHPRTGAQKECNKDLRERSVCGGGGGGSRGGGGGGKASKET